MSTANVNKEEQIGTYIIHVSKHHTWSFYTFAKWTERTKRSLSHLVTVEGKQNNCPTPLGLSLFDALLAPDILSTLKCVKYL